MACLHYFLFLQTVTVTGITTPTVAIPATARMTFTIVGKASFWPETLSVDGGLRSVMSTVSEAVVSHASSVVVSTGSVPPFEVVSGVVVVSTVEGAVPSVAEVEVGSVEPAPVGEGKVVVSVVSSAVVEGAVVASGTVVESGAVASVV